MAYGTVLGKNKDAFAGKLRRWNDEDKTVEFNVERVRGQYSIYPFKITGIYYYFCCLIHLNCILLDLNQQ